MIPDYPRIYLQPNEAGIGRHTWCQDRIEDTDIEYIRSDIADELMACPRQGWWPAMSTELVAILDRWTLNGPSARVNVKLGVLREAADELTALTADRDAARKVYLTLQQSNAVLAAKVALLAEALATDRLAVIEECAKEIDQLAALLSQQFEALDISREVSAYGIAANVIRALSKPEKNET